MVGETWDLISEELAPISNSLIYEFQEFPTLFVFNLKNNTANQSNVSNMSIKWNKIMKTLSIINHYILPVVAVLFFRKRFRASMSITLAEHSFVLSNLICARGFCRCAVILIWVQYTNTITSVLQVGKPWPRKMWNAQRYTPVKWHWNFNTILQFPKSS